MAKSVKYRLQPLLELKSRAKQKAELALAKALARLEGERKKLKRLETEKQQIIQRRKAVRLELHHKIAAGHALVKDGSTRINYLKKLDEEEKAKEEEIVNQKRVIEECEILVKRARRDYINAVKELRIIEKHKSLWAKKLQLEMTRLEEKEMDEIGNIIHQLRKVA